MLNKNTDYRNIQRLHAHRCAIRCDVDFRQPEIVKVDMHKYVEDVISGLKTATSAKTPAGLKLFVIDDRAKLLGK
jgi:hypothetical protein